MLRSTIFLLLIIVSATAWAAAPKIHMSVSSQGLSKIEVSASLPSENLADARVLNFLLPFQISSQYEISHPDNLEVSVTINRDNYALLTVIAAPNVSDINFTIDRAFSLNPDREKNRVKVIFDITYSNFKQYVSLVGKTNIVSQYDLEVELPQSFDRDVLAFNPGADEWTASSKTTYLLPYDKAGALARSAAPDKSVFIAFPNPFEDQSNTAAFVMGLVPGLISIVSGSAFIAQRRLSKWALVAIMVLTTFGLAAVAYFYFTLPNPLSFLTASLGIALTWLPVPFVCCYYLIRSRFDAEILGIVQRGGQPARFVAVSVIENGHPIGSDVIDNSEGEYRFLIWCWNPRQIHVSADVLGSNPVQSDTYSIERGKRVQVDLLSLAAPAAATPAAANPATTAPATTAPAAAPPSAQA
ncbi:MAG TPA: hypothetical protein VGO04_01790 [Ensifer sp.]|jgi:hypothetical protein|uniref:hypothetical protein n=1 Tax=Ensifer sp. TaxID=1872086 RepID=UPI002E1604AF|nr:hypothetical protein [Ensifer sp.]